MVLHTFLIHHRDLVSGEVLLWASKNTLAKLVSYDIFNVDSIRTKVDGVRLCPFGECILGKKADRFLIYSTLMFLSLAMFLCLIKELCVLPPGRCEVSFSG